MSKKLYRFHWDCGRMGDLEGVFVAEEKAVADLIGKHVYFGEVLGKHSEIEGVVEADDIVALTDDTTAIDVVEKYMNGGTGHNPFDHVGDEDEED